MNYDTTLAGVKRTMNDIGKVRLVIDGETVSLVCYRDAPEDDHVFLVFSDATNGKETYGGGRYMYGAIDVDGTMNDWNRNPRTTTSPRTAARRMASVRRGQAPPSTEACSFRDASAVWGVSSGGAAVIMTRVCVLAQGCPVVYAYRTSPANRKCVLGFS